jgi:transcriptional regulator with XRE-family HTH domain
MYPDDSHKDLATVLSYIAGRTLSKEEIWKAMGLPRSTYYDQLEKGTLITADNLRRAAANLGINRAELLTRYRLIDPEEVASLAEEIARLRRPLQFPPSRTGALTHTRARMRRCTDGGPRLLRRGGAGDCLQRARPALR